MTPKLKDAARIDGAFSLHLAECLSLLGEQAQALEWLENAIRRGFVNFPFLQTHSKLLDNVRGAERFERLLETAKCDWESLTASG